MSSRDEASVTTGSSGKKKKKGNKAKKRVRQPKTQPAPTPDTVALTGDLAEPQRPGKLKSGQKRSK